jgi:hypothetical protein
MKKNRLDKLGANGFNKNYWDLNYDEPKEMDGIGNAMEHGLYLKYLFALDLIDISTVIDFGFGLGTLFKEILSTFLPHKGVGIEPSPYAFKQVTKEYLIPVESTKLVLKNTDLLTWCKDNDQKKEVFDLGICTSVFQYLSDEEILKVLPILSKKVKYLYFSVPTDKELSRQVEEIEFDDQFAISRSRSFYQKAIKPHFTVVSSRVLESKYHFNEESTHFTELLFRN